MQAASKRTSAALACAAALGLPIVAHADGAEVFGGAYAHDINLGITVCCYEGGADVELGARTGPFVHLGRLGDLRAYALGSLNTGNGIDFAAAGVAWRFHVSRRVYIQPGIGGAIQNGDADQFQRRPNHLDLGSRVLFEPELSIGYQLSPRWAAEASYVHLSHAQLAGPQNPGMDDLGMRVVYRFGG